MKTMLVCLLPVFLLIGITPPAEAAAKKTNSAPQTIEELQQKIEAVMADHNVPGATITLVSRDGIIWSEEIGLSDVDTEARVDANTIFRWGSVSKSVVSTAVLMLAERGMVRLDDKVSDIAPDIEFDNRWETTHPVRLVHCLEHTTGFDDLHFNDSAVDEPDTDVTGALAVNPNSRRSRWQPGLYTSYCNIGPVVAARMVEIVSGQTFESFIHKEVFARLGMTTAGFAYPAAKERMSTGYGEDGVTPVPYDHIAYRPAGSLNATSRDIAAFVQMLLNRGAAGRTRFLTPASIERMETPHTTVAARAGFPLGYGLGSYTTYRRGHVFHGHEGMVAGFVAAYGYNTTLDRGFAVSINNTSDKALQQIIEAVVGYFTAGAEQPSGPMYSGPVQDTELLPGYYQSITPMSQLMHTLLLRFVNVRRVTVDNGALYSGNFLFGKKRELEPVSENGYHRRGTNECVAFVANGGDQLLSYGGLRGNFKKVSPIRAFSTLGAFILSIVLMISSVLFAVIWIPRKLLGRLNGVAHLKARFFSLLSVILFFVLYIQLLGGVMAIETNKVLMSRLGTLSIYSISIFVATLCFAALSFLALLFSLKAVRDKSGRPAHLHSLLVSIACVAVTIYLLYGNVIGIMTWAY